MRIDQLGRPVPQAGPRIRRRQDGFVVSEEAAPQEPAQATPLAATADIVAVAGAAHPAPASAAQLDREAAQHGDAMLKTLTKLQLSALGLENDEARNCLANLAGSLKRAADPGLDAVIQAIAARAAVEVARSR